MPPILHAKQDRVCLLLVSCDGHPAGEAGGGWRSPQRERRVLAIDVDQCGAELAQDPQGGGRAVHEAPAAHGAVLGGDLAADRDLLGAAAVVARQRAFRQPQRRQQLRESGLLGKSRSPPRIWTRTTLFSGLAETDLDGRKRCDDASTLLSTGQTSQR
jgi:hypothetical protein